MYQHRQVIRQPSVISAPRVPLPMETMDGSSSPMDFESDKFLDQFLNDFPSVATSAHQTSQQSMWPPQMPPAFESLDTVGRVAKQERESGFLAVMQHHGQQDDIIIIKEEQEEEETFSPEEHKKRESKLIKTELSCYLQLKMLKEGKDLSAEVESQPAVKDYPISEETRQLQKVRRDKNREAAKKCRQKKKASEREQEQKKRQVQKEIEELQQQLHNSRQEFSNLLDGISNMPCFISYLRQNRHLMQNPQLKQMLQKFVKSRQSSLLSHRCVATPVGQTGTTAFHVEQ